MKLRNLFFFIHVLLISSNISAQGDASIDSLIKFYKLNLAVPDLPAFKALHVEPSNLLRPNSPKEFSAVASQFYNGRNIVIPQSVAVELAPVVLAYYNRLTLTQYQQRPALYNIRLSLGTYRDSLQISKLAIGARTTLINKGDIKNDKNIKLVMDYLNDKSKLRNGYMDEFLRKNNISEEQFASSDSLQKTIGMSFESYYSAKRDSLNKILRSYNEKNWNAEKLDIAFSLVGASPDSLSRNIRYNAFSFWLTYALPIRKHGQFLIGVNYFSYALKNSVFNNINIPARAYIGSNQIKFFVESQYTFKQRERSNHLLASSGLEYNISNGLWVDFNAGFYKDLTGNASHFVSSFKLVYALPGNFR